MKFAQWKFTQDKKTYVERERARQTDRQWQIEWRREKTDEFHVFRCNHFQLNSEAEQYPTMHRSLHTWSCYWPVQKVIPIVHTRCCTLTCNPSCLLAIYTCQGAMQLNNIKNRWKIVYNCLGIDACFNIYISNKTLLGRKSWKATVFKLSYLNRQSTCREVMVKMSIWQVNGYSIHWIMNHIYIYIYIYISMALNR